MVWWESTALMAIIRTQKITRPSIKINDLSALNKRPISEGSGQKANGFLKLNQKWQNRRKFLPELRPSILSASEGKSFAFVSEKVQLVQSQLLLVGCILLYEGIACPVFLKSVGNIYGNLSQLFYLTIPNEGIQAKVSKGTVHVWWDLWGGGRSKMVCGITARGWQNRY